ncbi:MAG TPA: hypothetical protein VNO14_04140 [Blastocatellia bacterium]|nr:hypothetical protein [Blastocatellia bacterium]
MAKAVLILTLVISPLPGLSASQPSAHYEEGKESLKQPTGEEKHNSSKPANQQDEDAEGAQPVLWDEPSDLENRDLFYGIGGQKGAPDTGDRFLFIRRDTGGSAEKIIVEDTRKRRWTIKLGLEPRTETTATRIVWAVGYHVDQDYFVKRAHIEGRGGFDVWDARFERDDDGFKKVGRWDWNSNPFAGTRELDGLKTLMAFLNNFDLKTENNKVVRPAKKKPGEPVKHIYYVNDLEATLGSTGYWFTDIPIIGELPSGTKGIAEHYAEHKLIEAVRKGEVVFHMKRRRARRAIKGVKVENARWIGNLLASLSDKQLTDAFRAGGFNEAETAVYLRAMRDRIRQLQNLR